MRTKIHVVLGMVAVMSGGCAKQGTAEPSAPSAESGDASGASEADASCPPGGPSVSINVTRPSGDSDISREELGALLGWIGSFAQPCRELPVEAHHFTVVFELNDSGEPLGFDLVEREQHPELASCLDEGFANALPSAHGPMRVSIVIPWRCNTLGPGFAAVSDEAKSEAPGEAAEPPAP